MKKLVCILHLCVLALSATPTVLGGPKQATTPATIYFTKDVSGAGVLRVFDKIKAEVRGPTGIKVHFGEEGNRNYLRPEWVKPLAQKLSAPLVETNVLYVSPRHQTQSHLALARKHGFDFSAIDILDSAAEVAWPCSTGRYAHVLVGSHTQRYNTIVVVTHFKGHGLSGFGGAIKNVAMGLASPMGKRAMHANLVPGYDSSKCIRCGACTLNCQGKAIAIDPVRIDPRKCIGCGQCLKVCPAGVYSAPQGRVGPEEFERRLAEYAKAIADSVHLVYVSVLANISADCDCAGRARRPFVKDIGVLASTDPVAIDQASLDLVNKAHKSTDAFKRESGTSGAAQLAHGERIGLGTRRYRLVDLDGK